MTRRLLAALAMSALLITGSAATAPAVLAHSDLESSDPADGAVLDAPPTTVSFTFNEDLLPDFVAFVATDPSGTTSDLPVASVDGPTATIDWPATAPGGEWTVSYRVVSQDGHPIEGGITFTYAAASPSPSPPTPAPTSASPTPSPTSPEPSPTSAEPSPTTSPASDTGGSPSGPLIAGLVIAAIAVIGVIVALVARRRG